MAFGCEPLRASRAQWWFDSTSPAGETKLAEQPDASRTEDRRRWSAQSDPGVN